PLIALHPYSLRTLHRPRVPSPRSSRFFLSDPATTEISTLSLHDALPICLLAARDDDGAHAVVRVEFLERLAKLLHELRVERVHLLGAVQRDDAHAIALLRQDQAIAHRSSPPSRRCRSGRRGTPRAPAAPAPPARRN